MLNNIETKNLIDKQTFSNGNDETKCKISQASHKNNLIMKGAARPHDEKRHPTLSWGNNKSFRIKRLSSIVLFKLKERKKAFLGLTPEKNERAVSKDKFVIKKLGWNFDLWNLLAFKSRNGNSKHLRSLPFPFLLFINDALCAHYVPFHYHLTPIYMCKERKRETVGEKKRD